MSQTNKDGGQGGPAPETLRRQQQPYTQGEVKQLVAEATGGTDVREYGGDAIGGAGGGQPSNLGSGVIGGGFGLEGGPGPTGGAGADAQSRGSTGRMAGGGTLGGGTMGQHGMDAGPIQHTGLDPARNT